VLKLHAAVLFGAAVVYCGWFDDEGELRGCGTGRAPGKLLELHLAVSDTKAAVRCSCSAL
jgi:hypothetical protein